MALAATIFNVESTLNWFLRDNLEHKGDDKHPVLEVPVYVVTHAPREQLTHLPAYSVHHHAVDSVDFTQGNRVGHNSSGEAILGARYSGLVDISIWVKRPDTEGQERWQYQMRVLYSDLASLRVKHPHILVRDFEGNTTKGGAVPTEAYDQTRIDFRGLRPGAGSDGAQADPKAPDLMRRRFVIPYVTELRSIAS